MEVKVGDLYLCDGWRLVLVVLIEYDGISEDVVKVRWKGIDFWCNVQRLKPLLPTYPPTR